ncbi:unnamed protein product [Meloidogyne enterolobii]|uniref:Uncharacterized protein n=1 Tax=Meloidogyne enterolobii TaxID=390850 RepID=A0ACB0YE20_MELEN
MFLFSHRLNILFHCTTGSCELSPSLLLPFFNREVSLKSECRLILFLSIPLAIANYLIVYQNVPQKVQPVVFGQILVCLGILLFICALESLCRTANLLLTISAFIVSMFLPIGQHVAFKFKNCI